MTVKKTTQRQGFKTNEFIVYPAHGVGQIMAIEEQEVAGLKLELFVINFVKDKMTLRVPTTKVAVVGMRKLAEESMVRRALETLKGRARIKRTMWSRRAQEYEAKINSGNIVAISEVVRDLYRSETQPVRGGAGSAVARDLGRSAYYRDRGDQGNRGRPCQGSAPRRPEGRRNGRGRSSLTGSCESRYKGPAHAGPFVFLCVLG
jgi:RNA polymerase-interacting CarD/CdnL/TRCF family regulator